MIRPLSSILLLLALGSASCQKEQESKTPSDTPKELPETAVAAEVSIASVTIGEDCPDANGASAAVIEMADQDREAPPMGASADYAGDMPCSQSSIQIAITGQGDSSSKLSIRAIRFLGPKGQDLGTLVARAPTIWKAEGYSVWDEMVMPKTDVKASYKLSTPSWAEVQSKLGGSTFGPLYRLEADIMIGDVKKTVRSAEITREQVEMVDT